uniref:Uncharacterized protein n=1 Tax=Mycena chlorophos TaxID=658473 RepID=A0ABQ0LWT0_MYCCL|nr:predicted protein [Mycena chlorophos]
MSSFAVLRRESGRPRRSLFSTEDSKAAATSLVMCEEDLVLVTAVPSQCAMAAVEEKVHSPSTRSSPEFFEELTASPKSVMPDLPRTSSSESARENADLWTSIENSSPGPSSTRGFGDAAERRPGTGDSELDIVIDYSGDTLAQQVQALGRRALDGVPTLLRTLETLAKVHPFVELAFIPFRLLYYLEVKRRDNDHRRAALFGLIKDAMLALVELEYFTENYTAYRTTPAGQKIKSRIVGVCEQMQKDIRGCYEELLAHDRSAPAMHFVRAGGRNKVLTDYGARFKATREDLVFALQIENAVAVNRMRHMLEEQLVPKLTAAAPQTAPSQGGPQPEEGCPRAPTNCDPQFPVPPTLCERLMDPTSKEPANDFSLAAGFEILSGAQTGWEPILALREQLLGDVHGAKFHNDVGRDRPPGSFFRSPSTTTSLATSIPSPSFSMPAPFPSPQLPPYELIQPRTPPMYWSSDLEGYFSDQNAMPRALTDPRNAPVAPWPLPMSESSRSLATIVGEGSPFVVGLDITGSDHFEQMAYRPNPARGWSFGEVSRELDNTCIYAPSATESDLDDDDDEGTVIGDSESDSETDSDDGAIYMRPISRKQSTTHKVFIVDASKTEATMPGFLDTSGTKGDGAERASWRQIVGFWIAALLLMSIPV